MSWRPTKFMFGMKEAGLPIWVILTYTHIHTCTHMEA